MKRKVILILIVLGSVGFGAVHWGQAGRLRAENLELRRQLAEQETVLAAEADERRSGQEAEVARLKKRLEEVHQLRGDVARLRGQAEEAERLRAANRKLQARAAAFQGQPSAPVEPEPSIVPDSYPKESWSFAGYDTPENALVTAIWAMQQGTPETYLDSLAPEEQVRMAERWQGKSEQEIAAKHQSDVTRISGIRVTGRQDLDADNIVMNVQIEGVDRAEKVSMKRVDGQWKFAGYIREPEQ